MHNTFALRSTQFHWCLSKYFFQDVFWLTTAGAHVNNKIKNMPSFLLPWPTADLHDLNPLIIKKYISIIFAYDSDVIKIILGLQTMLQTIKEHKDMDSSPDVLYSLFYSLCTSRGSFLHFVLENDTQSILAKWDWWFQKCWKWQNEIVHPQIKPADNIEYSHVAIATEYHLTMAVEKQDLSPSAFIIPPFYSAENKSWEAREHSRTPLQNLCKTKHLSAFGNP